ncbi:hypothetical protein [Streptomyces sp. 184]
MTNDWTVKIPLSPAFPARRRLWVPSFGCQRDGFVSSYAELTGR